MTSRLLLALAVALIGAAPADAQTVLLSDDAEGAIEDKWVVGKPTNDTIKPWQRSDSTTPKVRGNMAHEGATSYWSGQSPPFDPANVVEGSSFLTTKTSFVVPADGVTSLSLFSFFQNEGDDAGLVEAAVDTGGTLAWRKVAEYKLQPSTAGDSGVTGYCNPIDPAGTVEQDWEEVKGTLGAYAGKKIFLRMHLKYGPENRAATQPCGWYVDDIKVSTTGTPGNAGATDPAGGPALAPAPSSSASIKFGAFKAKGKKARLGLTVSGGSLSKVTATLLRGSKKVATAKFTRLDSGKRRVIFKSRKKLKKGIYKIRLSGTQSDGSSYLTTGRVKVK